jgi:hypothetical protein
MIETMQTIASKRAPKVYFELDGLHSGIKLPEFEKFVSPAYSISLWFCIESLDHIAASPYYEPRLFRYILLLCCYKVFIALNIDVVNVILML